MKISEWLDKEEAENFDVSQNSQVTHSINS
jgi:hypothetical protein